LRAATFLLADGVRPSNKETGYVLRRLVRRLFFYEKYYGLKNLDLIIEKNIDIYGENYEEILTHKNSILEEIIIERNKFSKSLDSGIRKASKLDKFDSEIVFKLYETEGLSFEIIKEIAEHKGFNLKREDFEKEFAKHQEISRAGQEKKFGGHGLVLNTGELKAGSEEELKKVTRLHTATHLLQKALREVLGNDVEQRGSDITAERTRFDFSHPRKLTAEEIKKVEDTVNEIIKKDLPVNFKEMSIVEAKKTGALYFFKEKYPEKVKVYFIGNSLENAWSKEFCGGPHVTNTSEVGRFKILKEEAVAAGIRRIRATVQ
ncbi:MAG: alanine--tRNA ligase-related protein, partial [Patescibacteria group bacterium]